VLIISLVANALRLILWPLSALRRAFAAPAGAYVVVDLDGAVVELERPRRRLPFLPSAPAPVALTTLRELIKMLAVDARVSGLLLRIGGLAGGAATIASLRDLLSELRAAGKDVVAYLPDGADTRALYVASAARLIVVGPETMVSPLGYAAIGRYVRRALDRVGVEAEVFARGAYKSGGESLVRESMSEAHREQLDALLGSHHDELVTALARGRRVPPETARRWIDEAPHAARAAAEIGMVDAVAYEDELSATIAGHPSGARAGEAVEPRPEPSLVPYQRYMAARRATRFRPLLRAPAVGVIEIHGPIVSRARLGLGPVAAEKRVVAALRAARRDASIRAVILHIDSPGGSAVPSNRIHHEVSRLAEVKPVIAYLSDVAASGAYYVAAAAHSLVAQPQTVTGSIGVLATRFVVGPLLARLGVATDVVKRGARADLFSVSRHLDAGERASVEREIDAFYRTFLEAVAKGRRRTVDEIEAVAQGRIYSGRTALSLGLVDCLGGFDRAMHEARDLAGVPGQKLMPRLMRVRRSALPRPSLRAELSAVVEAIGGGAVAEALEVGADAKGKAVVAYWAPGLLEL
jgi:protease-4